MKNRKFSTTKKIHKANNVFRCKFYFDPIIILEARGRGEGEGVIGDRALRARHGVTRKNRFKNQINRNANNK